MKTRSLKGKQSQEKSESEESEDNARSELNEAILMSPPVKSPNTSVNNLFSAGSRYELANLVENMSRAK